MGDLSDKWYELDRKLSINAAVRIVKTLFTINKGLTVVDLKIFQSYCQISGMT